MNRLRLSMLSTVMAVAVGSDPTGPLCGTCDLSTPAARKARKIVVTEDKASVEGCRLMGTVGGWEDLDKKNRAYALAVKSHLYDNGADPAIRVLVVHGGDDEAYFCAAGKAAPEPSASIAPAKADETRLRLYFPDLKLDRDGGERIESLSVKMSCGKFRSVGVIPADWALSVTSPLSAAETSMTFEAAHGAALLPSLDEIQGTVVVSGAGDSCFGLSATVTSNKRAYRLGRTELVLRP